MLKSLLDRALKHVFNDNRYHTLSRIQIEAYTDLLAMAMVIDHHIAQQERDLITHHLEQFEWPESRPSEHFINQSVRRAWGLLEATEKEAAILSYCKDIAERLDDDWLRQNAFVATVEIVQADYELASEESALLDHICEAFGLSDEDQERLYARAKPSTQKTTIT